MHTPGLSSKLSFLSSKFKMHKHGTHTKYGEAMLLKQGQNPVEALLSFLKQDNLNEISFSTAN